MHISLVIPAFNRGHCLARALDSVLAQRTPADEIILVDDGSTDDTRALLARRYPDVRYLYQSNRGVSAARNLGIREAKFDWVALLDSDDAWHPDKLTHQRAALSRQPGYRLCHCDEIWIRNGRRVNPMRIHVKAGEQAFLDGLPRCAISPSSVLVERRLLEDIGGFDESLPACEDYDLWLRICAAHPALFVARPLVIKYGGHADQLSRRHWGMDRFRIRALHKLLQTDSLPHAYEQAAIDTLLQKLDVLLAGARKRGNQALVEEYYPLVDQYRGRQLRHEHCA